MMMAMIMIMIVMMMMMMDSFHSGEDGGIPLLGLPCLFSVDFDISLGKLIASFYSARFDGCCFGCCFTGMKIPHALPWGHRGGGVWQTEQHNNA